MQNISMLRSLSGTFLILFFSLLGFATSAWTQETVCARVKIEIKQQVTLERQGFDAEMNIINTLDVGSLENIDISIKVSDELGNSVPITTDPNDTNAKFFLGLPSKQNISDISGNGSVGPKTTATIGWLLIPAPGAAGDTPLGKRYFIGASLKYKFGGDSQIMDVSPALVTVRPMPKLTLDYFLTKDVIGDDPLTSAIEPTEPFTLGVRVKNTGLATAKAFKIDSAQPRIEENRQGLLINFRLTGSSVNDAPTVNTLLTNFGDVPGNASKVGRWVMESSLAGRFVGFTANFSHADELGGAVTSLMQAVNTHFLIRDVRVDLPGRDNLRDFLALDGNVLRVYESEGVQDSDVNDRSAQATLVATTGTDGAAHYRLIAPATPGFMYVKLPDPFGGAKALGAVSRTDAKRMAPENVWLSKTQNVDTKQWKYWINFFDANTSGVYDAAYIAPAATAQPPALQFIPDRNGRETEQVSFIVEASSLSGQTITLGASPLPVGASFTDQGGGKAIFDWKPAQGQAGNYRITYTASDGSLAASQTAAIQVDTAQPPPGPGTPAIDAPLAGAEVASLRSALSVLSGTDPRDPTVAVLFELYSDEAMNQLVESGSAVKSGTKVTWTPSSSLTDNTRYWWRAKASNGADLYSAWVNGQFFVNLFNDPPEPFSLALPLSGSGVASTTPTLSLNNTSDKEGDVINYSLLLWRDAAMTDPVASAPALPPGDNGKTSWLVTTQLSNHGTYYWRAVATDSHGAETQTPIWSFKVDSGNTAPLAPSALSPVSGERVGTHTVTLTVANAADVERDTLSYAFELDTVSSFDGANAKRSGAVSQGSGGQTSWTLGGLVENARYYWRAKANDGRADSPWTTGSFLMDTQNDPPGVPTANNPGDRSWVASLQPTLQANPVADPEGDAVSYQFEIFRDSAGANRVGNGVADSPAWQVPTALADKTTYYWRVRTLDTLGANSAWSPMAVMYVSSQPYVNPSIALTSPSAVTDGRSRSVTVQWNGVDANIDPNLALYYDTVGKGYAGALIVDGLKQAAGSQKGSYVWDLTGLAPGAYYVYGVIYDAKGVGKAYAPGAVVVPNTPQTGSVLISPTSGLKTTEDGATASFSVQLSKAPSSPVSMSVSTSDTQRSAIPGNFLTFTPANWNLPQKVVVNGKLDCVSDGNHPYTVTVNSAVSLDPNYIGVPGGNVAMTSVDSVQPSQPTDDPSLLVCAYGLLSRNPASGGGYNYSYFIKLGNVGVPSSGVRLQLMSVPAGFTIKQGNLTFGAVNAGATTRSNETFVVFSPKLVLAPINSTGYVWKVISK